MGHKEHLKLVLQKLMAARKPGNATTATHKNRNRHGWHTYTTQIHEEIKRQTDKRRQADRQTDNSNTGLPSNWNPNHLIPSMTL